MTWPIEIDPSCNFKAFISSVKLFTQNLGLEVSKVVYSNVENEILFPFGYNKEIENTKVSLCLHYNVY